MQQPIRILHMIGSLEMGGSQSVVLNLYRAVDREKIQFDFIVDNPERMELAPVVEELGARIYTLPKLSGGNLFRVRKAWDGFFAEHPEYKVLHSHVRSYASVYLPIAKKHGVKTIIHSHNTSNGKGLQALAKALLQYPLRFQADYYFSCSQKAGRWLFGKRIAEGNRHHVLKNAVDLERYQFDPRTRQEYRDALGLQNSKTFIHIGRIHPAKNHAFLLEVFAQIVKKEPSAVLLLVGDGPLREEIENRIATLGLQNSVKMLGNRSDVPQLLQVADIFVFPSAWEGLPVAVVEAQTASIPCFISENITEEVVLSDLVVRLPVDKGPDCWTEQILQADPKRRDVTNAIRENGYDIQTTTRNMTAFYERLVNEALKRQR